MDSEKKGLVNHSDFIRCLSRSNMKCTEREVMKLVEELDKEQTGNVNYANFLKYSYLSQMYIYHFKLESLLVQSDTQGKGLVSVELLESVLQSSSFNFPLGAVDTVLIEMLGVPNMSSIDRKCFI